MTLSVRAADEADVDRVMELLAACIDGMRREGIDQWDDVYPNRETVLADAHEHTLFLGSLDAAPLVGAIVVNEYQSPNYLEVPWTITAPRIAVVHRVMVDPQHQGKGIARELMEFAEERARTLGYGAVRLDAFTQNPRALQLYRRLGYYDAGWVTFPKGVFRCFEKALD